MKANLTEQQSLVNKHTNMNKQTILTNLRNAYINFLNQGAWQAELKVREAYHDQWHEAYEACEADGDFQEFDRITAEVDSWFAKDINTVGELRARIAERFPEHVQEEKERAEAFDQDIRPTMQKFTKQLFMARAKQREKQVLAKPPGR